MNLGQRQLKILEAIIRDYVATGEPVGSRSISKKYMPQLSSATIRNEMSDLEGLGLLEQPHTSAGRVPSDLGYRMYVDSLMEQYVFTMQEVQSIKDALGSYERELDKILNNAASVLANLTGLAALSVTPEIKKATIKSVQIMYIDKYRVLFVLVTGEGIVKNKIIATTDDITPQSAFELSMVLTQELSGLTLEDISREQVQNMVNMNVKFAQTIMLVLEYIGEVIKEIDKYNVVVSGVINLLNFPEYSSIEKAKDILSFTDNKEALTELAKPTIEGGEDIHIIIGGENENLKFHNCSMVLCKYKVGDIIGTIGLIGPKRMDYAKTVSALRFMQTQFKVAMEKFGGDIKLLKE